MSNRRTYEARGSVRGACGHSHVTLRAAVACCEKDANGCASLGGGAYSDRVVTLRTPGNGWDELTPDEIANLESEYMSARVRKERGK